MVYEFTGCVQAYQLELFLMAFHYLKLVRLTLFLEDYNIYVQCFMGINFW